MECFHDGQSSFQWEIRQWNRPFCHCKGKISWFYWTLGNLVQGSEQPRRKSSIFLTTTSAAQGQSNEKEQSCRRHLAYYRGRQRGGKCNQLACSWHSHCSMSLSFHQESLTSVIILRSGRPEHPPEQQQKLHVIPHWDQSIKATSENLLSPLIPLDNPTQVVLQEAFPHKAVL